MNIKKKKYFIEFIYLKKYIDIIFFLLIPIFLLILIPVDYEPSGESFNEWATTKLFLEWEGFPKYTLSLGYVLYTSVLMSIFEYDVFILVEYILTFTFLNICFYLFLKSWLSPLLAFLTTLTFIIIFATIEGHNVPIAIGFVCLYFRQFILDKKISILPLNLILACTFHQAYSFALFGHILSYVIKYLQSKEQNIYLKMKNILINFNYKLILKTITILLLIIFYLFTMSMPSQRKDNNHYMDAMPWSPMEKTISIDIAIMHANPQHYLSRREIPINVENEDWYFTVPKLLKNSKNSLEAFARVPEIFIENISFNLRYLFVLPNSFVFKLHKTPVIVISGILCIITLLFFFFDTYRKKKYVLLLSHTFGQVSITLTLLLTYTNNVRFNVVLVPFIIFFLFGGINKINEKIYKYNFKYKFKLINILTVLMLIGSITSIIHNDKKFYLLNWSSIFNNENGYRNNFNTLKKLVRKDDILLVEDSKWVKGFFDIHYSNINSIYSLPPYKDNKKINDLKQNITQFWVTKRMQKPHIRPGTSNNRKRYDNYFLPLIEKAKKENWEIIKIGSFGTVYRKKSL